MLHFVHVLSPPILAEKSNYDDIIYIYLAFVFLPLVYVILHLGSYMGRKIEINFFLYLDQCEKI